MITITGGKLVSGQNVIDNPGIKIDGTKIVEIGGSAEGVMIDAGDNYVSPGFIDPHVHGGIGYRYETDNVEELNASLLMSAKSGVTSLCPALGLKDDKVTDEKIGILKAHCELVKNVDGVESYGLHIEGPYCDVGNVVTNPEPKNYMQFLKYSDGIKRWTLMPELEGAKEFMQEMLKRNIYPSLGHCNPKYECIQEALDLGIIHVTHLYTGMSGVYRDENAIRRAGLVETALMDERIFAEVLCDGHHLDKVMIKFILKTLGTERFCTASDSHYREIREGETYDTVPRIEKFNLPTRVALMSQMPFNEMIRWLHKEVGISIPEIARISSGSTARALKVDDRKGRIAEGYDADIVIFDEDIDVKFTIARGKTVYNSL